MALTGWHNDFSYFFIFAYFRCEPHQKHSVDFPASPCVCVLYLLGRDLTTTHTSHTPLICIHIVFSLIVSAVARGCGEQEPHYIVCKHCRRSTKAATARRHNVMLAKCWLHHAKNKINKHYTRNTYAWDCWIFPHAGRTYIVYYMLSPSMHVPRTEPTYILCFNHHERISPPMLPMFVH